ncbi:DUF3054 domain-containing protein [Marisediminicola senii]|uniref:DUF3054 domain-containing protein n=1 Tax=Marisediminicola senii TaxID=2711233 RepID=UPI0013EC09D3|nr:DUF3054 domain-containing protein [Marisediminicola senii]
MPTPSSRALSIVADVSGVLAFVAIGRASHTEGITIAGVAETAWPFLAGLAVGWVVTRAWRGPGGPVRPGLVIWGCTVVVGIALRAAVGDGVQPSFVVVTAIVLGALLVGWRAVARAVTRRRTARITPAQR